MYTDVHVKYTYCPILIRFGFSRYIFEIMQIYFMNFDVILTVHRR